MNFLFIHQSFPGQYRYILRALAASNRHNIVGLGMNKPKEPIPQSVRFYQYSPFRGNTPGIHDWLLDLDSKIIRGEAVASLCTNLKQQGFIPDLICAHPGWGEALFLRDIWPQVPLLSYQEFFYNPNGFDSNFDPEIQGEPDWNNAARLRMKNANHLLMLDSSTWNITPTFFQRSSFPFQYQNSISVIHDGIDTSLAHPNDSCGPLRLNPTLQISRTDHIVTFVNRTIEPYRGCHTFIRSLPLILNQDPRVKIIIVGSTQGVSYGQSHSTNNWRDVFVNEISSICDMSRVHFVGSLPYHSYLQLLQLSSCHVYLTYPFVLSWSLLEAMSTGLPIVASSTSPVLEVIDHGTTGLLVDFFSPDDLASSVLHMLTERDYALKLGENARNLILEKYSLERCVPRQLALIDFVSSNVLP